jgi:hypothetical protein
MSHDSRLAISALVAVMVVIATDVLLTRAADVQAVLWFSVSVRLTVYALAAATAAMAANTFGWWREETGRPWTLFTIEFALLFVNYALRRTAPNATLALDATAIALNLAQVGAFWLMSRTLHSAGIGHVIGTERRIALTVVAFVVAVIIAHSSILNQWKLLMSGEANVASVIGVSADVITFTLIAPLALSMIALRGGQVFWIFALLTVSVFGWMFNDAGQWIAGFMGGGDDAVRTARMAGVAIAAMFSAAAAATQWSAARRTIRGALANA